MKYSNSPATGERVLDAEEVQVVLEKANRWVTEFTQKLDDEVTLLSGDELDGLAYVAERKQQLLLELGSLESKLLSVFTQHKDQSAVRILMQQLKKCKIRNQENQRIVMLQLDYTNKGLELLRSLLKMNDLSLYSDQGELSIKREKRRIGSA